MEFDYGRVRFAVETSDWSGLERVLVDNHIVSTKRSFGFKSTHEFDLSGLGRVRLDLAIAPLERKADYSLSRGAEVLAQGTAALPLPPGHGEALETAQQALQSGKTFWSSSKPQPPQSDPSVRLRRRAGLAGHAIVLAAGAFKLLKTANAVKVALAGSAFAGWSLLLDWRFATMIISIIVFHEYGHVRAMKRCGIPTKGFYLIPFVGGVALGEKARSYWQEVYVAMMGPVFGLLMSVVAWAAYLATDIEMIGLVAAFGALINLLNLLPVYPLDGGHVLKAIALSASPHRSIWLLLAVSGAGILISARLGLLLLTVFLVLGTIDLIATRRSLTNADTEKMDTNAIVVSLLWYVAVVAAFVVMILSMAASDVPGSEIPRIILSD